MKFLVTGGSGYIGSHTCVELINAGYQVVILDNLSNSKKSALQGVAKITGKEVSQDLLSKEGIFFYEADIRNREVLQQIFTEHKIDVVLHFAGDKAVGDSICDPIKYYNNSLMGTVLLLEEMQKFNIKKIIYSSSATVYGNPKRVPIEENDNTGNCLNPYGRSKYFSEQILQDLYKSDPTWSIAILRYFNPVGAHPSSIIGEYPNGIPTNLMPYIAQVASGRLEKLKIFGDDYPTLDGTGVRDYIHVVDLAKGHIAALKAVLFQEDIITLNLGTGNGTSVLELVKEFEKVNKVKIPYIITERREGDIAECWTSIDFAKDYLQWKTLYDIEDMCRDSWNWQRQLDII